MKKSQGLSRIKSRNDIPFGALLMGATGVLIGAFLGYRTGDQDILIIASGTGGAIGGFIGAQVSLFFKTNE